MLQYDKVVSLGPTRVSFLGEMFNPRMHVPFVIYTIYFDYNLADEVVQCTKRTRFIDVGFRLVVT